MKKTICASIGNLDLKNPYHFFKKSYLPDFNENVDHKFKSNIENSNQQFSALKRNRKNLSLIPLISN